MATTLGHILHRLSCAFAAALLTWAALHGAALTGLFTTTRITEDTSGQVIFCCITAVAAWLFGRSCRFLLVTR